MNQELAYRLLGAVENLQSPDKAPRTAAESYLNERLAANPTEFFGVFAMVIRDPGTPVQTRASSAILFRQFSRRLNVQSPQKLESFISLPEQPRLEIQNILFEALQNASDYNLRKQIGNAVSEVARQYVDNAQNPSSLEPILQWTSTENSVELQEAAFRILASTPQLLAQAPSPQHINQIISQGLTNSELKVRLASLSATVAFLSIKAARDRHPYQDTITYSINILQHLKHSGDDENLCTALQSVLELAGEAWEMFEPQFDTLFPFLFDLVAADGTEDDVRQAALELLTTFAELAPDQVKLQGDFTSTMVRHCLKLMAHMEDDDSDSMETWNSTSEVDEDSESISLAAERSLDRLALSLCGDAILPVAIQYIPQMIDSGDWKMQHAALMAISVISEGCHDEMLVQLEAFLKIVVPMLGNSHPRVQWAACNAIGQMSTDFSNDIQNQYADVILPNVIPVLSSPSPRVQSHAAASLVNFCEEASAVVLRPYVASFMGPLGELMKSNKLYVREQTFSTIAAIANAIEDDFGNYYQQVMPYLFDVLENTGYGPDFRLLKAKAMECTTLIAIAVKKERMGNDLLRLVNLLIDAQQNITDDSDPQASYLLHSWCRLSRVLGPDFEPYLKYAINPVLTVAETEAKFKLLEEFEAAELKTDPTWHVRLVKGQYLGLNTGIFDEQCAAIELLAIYAQSLGALFEPYVHSILENIAIKNLIESPHPGIQTASANCIPSLLKSLKEKHGLNSPDVQKLWQNLSMCLTSFLSSETNPDPLADVFDCYCECVGLFGENALTAEQMEQFVESTSVVLSLFETEEVVVIMNSGDVEDDDVISYQSLLSEINKAFHAVFKSMNSSFLPSWNLLQPHCQMFSNAEISSYRQFVLCLYDNVIEFCGPDSAQYSTILVPVLDAGLQDPYQANRQAAAFGLLVAAKHGGKEWASYVFNHLPTLYTVVRQANEIGDAGIYARETACASIATILDTYSSAIPNFDDQVKEWIHTLPVINDNDVATPAYSFLIRLMEEQSPAFAAEGVRCLTALSQAFGADILVADLKKRAIDCLVKLSTVPGFADVFNSVPDFQRNMIMKHVSAGQEQSS